jgi:hypothetical protein
VNLVSFVQFTASGQMGIDEANARIIQANADSNAPFIAQIEESGWD